MARIKLLLGAPEYSACLIDEHLTVTTLLPAFARLVDGAHQGPDAATSAPQSTGSNSHPAWRFVPMRRQHLRSDLTQRYFLNQTPATGKNDVHLPSAVRGHRTKEKEKSTKTPTSFPSTSNSFYSDEMEFDEQQSLYDESLTLHEDLVKTQFTSLTQNSPANYRRAQGNRDEQLYQMMQNVDLSKLRDIPTPSRVASLNPQTITMNTLVGVVAKAPIRTVTIRRTGQQVDMIELVVGDETLPSFQVTLWLGNHRDNKGNLRDAVEAVQVGDVILLQNVALQVYRRAVFGQSLGQSKHGRRSRFATAIYLISKNYERLERHAPSILTGIKKWVDSVTEMPTVHDEKQSGSAASATRPLQLLDLPDNNTPVPERRRLRPRKGVSGS